MDTESKEMCELHSQPEDEATISSILGAVFPVEKEKETTITVSPDKFDKEGITIYLLQSQTRKELQCFLLNWTRKHLNHW